MTTKQYETDAIIPTGEILSEELEARGISPKEFAKQIGVTSRVMSGILLGDKLITAEIALAMEQALGISAQTWMNFEASYRLALAKRKQAKSA